MTSKKNNYLNGVVSRLVSLGKSILDFTAPVAVTLGVDALIGKACERIEAQLKQLYIKTAMNSAITLLINSVGILCLIFRPFGQKSSLIITVLCFMGAICFFFVRLILWIREYGYQTFELIKIIIETKNVHKGIEQYILSSFPVISLTYTGIEIGEAYIPALKKVPRIPELIDYFAKIFWKRIALFTGFVSFYTVSVFWILKPIIIHRYL